MKNSRSGIASFVLSICSLIYIIVIFVVLSASLEYFQSIDSYIAGIYSYHWLAASSSIVVLLLFIQFALASILGLIFGVIGLKNKKSKQNLAKWGTLINGIMLVFLLIFFITHS